MPAVMSRRHPSHHGMASHSARRFGTAAVAVTSLTVAALVDCVATASRWWCHHPGLHGWCGVETGPPEPGLLTEGGAAALTLRARRPWPRV